MIIVKRLTQEKPIIFESSEEKILNINTIGFSTSEDKKFCAAGILFGAANKQAR